MNGELEYHNADYSSDSKRVMGEYVLADAVLREAIREYRKFARYRGRRGTPMFDEVEQWFSADDRESCFSFINICQMLGLEPTYIRAGLQMWRDRVVKQNRNRRFWRSLALPR